MYRLRTSSLGAVMCRAVCERARVCAFERLAEVKLLPAAGRRERTDERPLHHPNGIHKTLNQRRSHGFGWVKPKKETKPRGKKGERGGGGTTVAGGGREAHARTALKTYTSVRLQCKQHNAAGRQSRGEGRRGEVERAKTIRIWGRELIMPCCPLETLPSTPTPTTLHWPKPRLGAGTGLAAPKPAVF